MFAKDLMTKTEILVPKDMLITDLAALLREKRIGGVPVIDEFGKICGVVTVSDLFQVMSIVRKLGGKRNWFSNFMFSNKTMTVKDIYTRKIYSVLPDTPIEVVVGLMLDKNIHTIPVMSEDQSVLYGVIGRHDVTCAGLGLTNRDKAPEKAKSSS